MSDKLSDIYPIPVQFVPGQQPTAAFLNAWADQIDLAFEVLAGVIGDFYSEDATIRGSGSHGGTFITNLTRTIGNTGWLNSLLPPGIEAFLLQEFEVLSWSFEPSKKHEKIQAPSIFWLPFEF